MRRRGKLTLEVAAILDREARLRVQSLTLKELAHATGLNRSTVQTHLARLIDHYRQKVVSHETNGEAHLRE